MDLAGSKRRRRIQTRGLSVSGAGPTDLYGAPEYSQPGVPAVTSTSPRAIMLL